MDGAGGAGVRGKRDLNGGEVLLDGCVRRRSALARRGKRWYGGEGGGECDRRQESNRNITQQHLAMSNERYYLNKVRATCSSQRLAHHHKYISY